LADCADRTARGRCRRIPSTPITSALSTFSNIRKGHRQEQLALEVREEFDRMFGEARGATLHFRRK
jgi:hypothetical protein